jgi:hypothetical protein
MAGDVSKSGGFEFWNSQQLTLTRDDETESGLTLLYGYQNEESLCEMSSECE